MGNIPKHKLYDDAATLFIEQGLTCNAISEQLGITEATLSKWRGQMNWEARREDYLSSPGKIKELLQKELKSVAAGNKTLIDTDALSKIAKTLQYFDEKVSLPVIVSVFREFDNFMVEIDPVMAVTFTQYHKMFINRRAQTDSLK
jgi:transposase-like protein